MDKSKLIEKRMKLASEITHYRLMISRNYHPEFFTKLLRQDHARQAECLRRERALSPEDLIMKRFKFAVMLVVFVSVLTLTGCETARALGGFVQATGKVVTAVGTDTVTLSDGYDQQIAEQYQSRR